MLYESGQEFSRDSAFLEVVLAGLPVGPKDMIRYIQGCDLAKPRELVLDQIQEDNIHDVYYLYTQGNINSGVP